MYEGGIQVPLMVRINAVAADGDLADVLVTDPVAVWDLLPTIADLTDAPSAPWRRRHLPPVTAPPASLPERPRSTRSSTTTSATTRRSRWGRWKAIRFNGAPLELRRRTQLGASDRLAAEHPDLLAHAEPLMAKR